ncbi:MAG: PAS domain S-box protein, partial [Anaerolineae bacterium]|nr:PAS domain S-box protein [Anaerolineae bacterium]
IVERKRAEEALAEERNRLRTLIDNMPDLIYVKDTESRFILGNVATALAAKASAPEQLVGKSDFDFYPEELADRYYQDEQTVIRTGQPLINQEEPFINPAGLRTWNLTTKVPLRDIQGTIIGLVGVSRDISKRKKVEQELNKYRDHLEELVRERTVDLTRVNERLLQEIKERTRVEKALRESEQELQMILTSITEYVWSADIVDGQVQYRYYSPVVEQMTGYPPEYYMSGVEAWLKTIYPDDRPQAEFQVARELSGEVISHEYRITRPEGEVIWLQGTTSPTLDQTGAVVRLQGVVSEITERKQLEAQLRQAQKMEAIGTLAGGIAHDFNNMLTAVIGYADLALDLLTPDHPVYDDIRGIRKISDRAADLTRQLLAFARRQMIEPDVLNLNDLILNLGEMLGRLIGEDIALEIQPAPDLGQIRVDPNQIEQVLVNLVVNARDAILNGGQITITTANVFLDDDDVQERAEIVPGQYVRLAVHDNGTGMTEEVKSHIFEPFFTTKDVGEGTGLGLATSFGIIKQSQGHIEVESGSGLGTTVEVFLPQVEEVGSGLPQARSSQDVPLGRATVMLVEDDSSVRHLTARMLRHHGYTVIEAGNGEEALVLYKQQPDNKIDLVITDVVMPLMGGKPLADQIRAIRPESKILFVSGYTDKILAHKDILEPGVGFLHKPYSPEMLIRKVHNLLTGSKSPVT